MTTSHPRIVLLGAPNAGKSRLLATIADAAGVSVAGEGGVQWITTITAQRHYTIVDAPAMAVEGQLVHGADATILVVAAADGALPMTKRHVELAAHMHVPVVLVYLDETNVDDVELSDLVAMECRELLTKFGMNGDAVAVVRSQPSRAAHTSSPVPAIASALDAYPWR